MKVKQSLRVTGVTQEQYEVWCFENKRNKNKLDTKKDFFYRILTGRLVKNGRTGKLEKHRAIKEFKELEW